jgi:hypothetical protein
MLTGLLLFTACGREPESNAPGTGPSEADSFTFFNIGKHSRLDGNTRGGLEKILGDAAVERRGIVNLAINYGSFLADHFPELDRMNRALNSDIGLRVKHPVTRLMYRYARQKGLPYSLVEFIYSESSLRPILIRLHYTADNPDALKTLKEKYGRPRKITWGRENASTRVWEKDSDFLFFNVIPKRGYKVEYRIDIYFTAAIERLIAEETAAAASQTSQRTGF